MKRPQLCTVRADPSALRQAAPHPLALLPAPQTHGQQRELATVRCSQPELVTWSLIFHTQIRHCACKFSVIYVFHGGDKTKPETGVCTSLNLGQKCRVGLPDRTSKMKADVPARRSASFSINILGGKNLMYLMLFNNRRVGLQLLPTQRKVTCCQFV
jgi:hypothetical protein